MARSAPAVIIAIATTWALQTTVQAKWLAFPRREGGEHNLWQPVRSLITVGTELTASTEEVPTQQHLLATDAISGQAHGFSTACNLQMPHFDFGSVQKGRISVSSDSSEGAPLTMLTIDGEVIPIDAFSQLSIGLEREQAIHIEYHARTEQTPYELYKVISGELVVTATIAPEQEQLCVNIASAPQHGQQVDAEVADVPLQQEPTLQAEGQTDTAVLQ